jgi:DNA-binding transcriptional regulator PaaX
LPELTKKILITTPPVPSSIRRGSQIQTPLLDKEGVGGGNPAYALTRSLKGLREQGLIENVSSGQNDYARLTKEGKKKATSLKIQGESSVLDPRWDGKWRIILLDLPESRKSERESLRYLLKKAGFVALKNSAWISPYPFENIFIDIKNELSLTTELMIIVTEFIDEETKKTLFKTFACTAKP